MHKKLRVRRINTFAKIPPKKQETDTTEVHYYNFDAMLVSLWEAKLKDKTLAEVLMS
jgi:hypothetical protein